MISTLSLFGGLLLSLPPRAEPASFGGLDAFPEPVAAAQDEHGTNAADLARLLDQGLQAVEAVPPAEVWRESEALVAAAGDAEAAAIDAAFEPRLARKDLSERARLYLAGARLAFPEPDRNALATILVELLGSKDDEIGRSAASLAGQRGFHDLHADSSEALVERLTEGAKEGSRSPEYRLECAVALHAQGRGEGQRAARKEMMEFLSSSDLRLQNLGALALARIGDVDTGRAQLERMAGLPGEEGRLAEAYLKQEDIRALAERRQQNLLKWSKQQTENVELKGDPQMKLIERVIDMIESTSLEGETHTREDLIDAALDGMLRSLDEHSSYLTPKAYKVFDQELLQAEYGGIGAYVGEDPDDHLFTIRQPIYSGPAYRAGLHTDDKIVRIEDWPTVGPNGSQPTDDIIKRLKGKPGTKVKLYVWRHGMDAALIDRPSEDMAVEVVREEITIPPVKAQLLPGGVALVQLTTFSRVASDELRAELTKMLGQGARAVVLDLRNNTGGLLTEARNVANLFLPKDKLVVSTESRSEEPDRLRTLTQALIPSDMPVAVLINGSSASASEIVSGALQDHQRAVIVGQRSFGKGSVQQLLPVVGVPDDRYADENHNNRFDPWEKLEKDWNGNGEFDYGPRVRMTIARYLLPSGRSIHREINEEGAITSEGGVEPDSTVRPKRYDAWKIDEMRRLQRQRLVRNYVDEKFPANEKLFQELAEADEDDVSRYPGFDEFFNGLGTTLTPNEIRMLVRAEVRGRVQDARGAAFPDGDFEEDVQLQKAIRIVLEKAGASWADVAAYATSFEPEAEKDSQASRLLASGMSDTARSSLRQALALIAEAKSGGRLSEERLDALQKALQSALKQ
jgi:carboxyl-terminal processing protease